MYRSEKGTDFHLLTLKGHNKSVSKEPSGQADPKPSKDTNSHDPAVEDADVSGHAALNDPATFEERTTTVIRLGSLLLAAGTGGYRVKRAMQRAAYALGIKRFDASVTLTNITATAYLDDDYRTLVSEAPAIGVNASRIEALETISRDISDGITNAELNRRIDDVVKFVKTRYNAFFNPLAAGFACAAFAVLNKFPPETLLFVLIGAFFGQLVRRTLAHRGINQLGVAALSGTVACLIYLGCYTIAEQVFPGFIMSSANAGFAPVTAGFVAAVLFLIPGFPMFTAFLDLAKLDINAGIQRFTYTISLLAAATSAVWLVSLVTGLAPLPQVANPYIERFGAEWWPLFIWVASFCGIFGFAILFNCSRRMALLAGAIGATANLLKFVLSDDAIVGLDIPIQAAAFIAALMIGLVASVVAPLNRIPRITLSVPSSVIMIPGAAMYRFIYYLNTGDLGRSLTYFFDAFLVVAAIGAGLAIARMVTDPHWLYDRRHPRFFHHEVIGRTKRALRGIRAARRAARRALKETTDNQPEVNNEPTQHAQPKFKD